MAQPVHDGAVTARALAEYATPAVTAAAEAFLDRGEHFVQQVILPRADCRGVDVLIAADAGEAIGEGDNDRRHKAFADQAIEPLRKVFAKANPIGVAQTATGKSDEVDQHRQSLAAVAGRDIHIHQPRRGIAEYVGL